MLVLSSKYNIEQVDFTDWMSLNHLTSLRKSTLIQKPSTQIPEALNQHGIVNKAKNYLSMNALTMMNECQLYNILILEIRNKYT